jgi:hypothetical protein
MKVLEPEPDLSIRTIVEAIQRRSVTANSEYQRGRAWKPDQQKVLVDSVLRGYPLPRFYFSVDEAVDPLGNRTTSMQIIDGLQRLLALSEYLQDKWPLLDPARVPNRFPRVIAEAPCPWAGLRYSELSSDLQVTLSTVRLPVVVIEHFDSTDELRDLFIRLQAGTALTRQQIRDAWPGAMSTYIERIAGKLTSRGRFEFLGGLDRRGSRRDDGDELDDPFHDGRQTAAGCSGCSLTCSAAAWAGAWTPGPLTSSITAAPTSRPTARRLRRSSASPATPGGWWRTSLPSRRPAARRRSPRSACSPSS